MALSFLTYALMLFSCTLAIYGHPTSWKAQRNDFLPNTITRRILKSPGVGGQGGTSFDARGTPTLRDYVNINRVKRISVSYGSYLESIQLTYWLSNDTEFRAPRRGTLKDSEVVITLAINEYLMKVEGYHNGEIVQQIAFTTEIFGYDNKTTHSYGPYGKSGNMSFSFEGYVVGFHGRFDDNLNNVGVYTLAPFVKSEEFGGANDSQLTYFDDEPDALYAPVSRMNGLKIYHGDAVDAISTYYTVLNGDIYQTYKHGGDGGDQTDIYFSEDEAIIGVEGSTDGQYIHQIKFITQYLRNGTVRGYGPYGKAASKQFSLYGNINGFSGSFVNYLHSFSVYYC